MGVFYFDNPAQERDLYEEIYNRQVKYKQTKDNISVDDATRATSISRMYPNFSPDVISALTLLQVKPEAEVLGEVSARITEHNQQNLLARVGNGFKGALRFGLLGLEDAYRTLVDRPINSFIASTFGDQADKLTFQDAYAQSGKSTVRQVVNQLRQGNRVNLGEGFLPDSDEFDSTNPNSKYYEEYQYMVQKGMAPDRAAQKINDFLGDPITDLDQRAQEESGQFTITTRGADGKPVAMPISLGRATANLFMEPGTKGFDAVSGIIDMGKIMFLDPANYFGLGIKNLTKNRRMLTPSDELLASLKKKGIQGKKGSSEFTNAQKKTLGINDTGKYKYVNKRQVNNYLDYDDGGEDLVRFLASNDDTNRFITLTGINNPEILNDFRKIQVSKRPLENKEKAVRALLNDKYLANPFMVAGFGMERPTVGALGRITGRLAESALGSRLDPGLKGAGQLFGARKVLKASLMENSRAGRIIASYAQDLPYRFLDIDQMEQTIGQSKLWMDQTTLSSKDKSEVLDQLIRIEEGDEAALFDVVRDMMARTANDLIEDGGVSRPDAEAITRIFDEELPEYRKFWINAVTGENVATTTNFVPTIIDGKPTATPGPQLLTEFINRTIPLPDAQGLAKAYNSMGLLRSIVPDLFKGPDESLEVGKLYKLLGDKKSVKGVSTKIADYYMSEIWKPLVLLRGAWTVRVVGEEQLRMYARGYDQIFSRPLSWMSQFITNSDDAAKVKRWNSKGVTYNDLFGDPFSDAVEAQQASSRIAGVNNNDYYFGGERKGQKKPGPHKYKILAKKDIIRRASSGQRTGEYNEYLRNFLAEVAKLHNDDLFRFLYRNDVGDLLTPAQQQRRLLEWMEGKSARAKEIIKLYNKGGPSFRRSAGTVGGRYSFAKALEARAVGASGGDFNEKRDLLEKLVDINDVNAIDLVQDNPFTISRRLKASDDLLTMIKSGAIDGIELDEVFKELTSKGSKLFRKQKGVKADNFKALVNTLDENFENLPQYITAPFDDYLDATNAWDKFTTRNFDRFMGSKTDTLSRSPVFRQIYWRQIYDMLPYMSPGMRDRLLYGGTIYTEGQYLSIKGAIKANIPDANLLSRLRFTPRNISKKDVQINLDMFKNEVERLNKIDAEAGNVSVSFRKDIEKLQKQHAKDKRAFLDELEQFQGDKYYIGKGKKYTDGTVVDFDFIDGELIKKGSNKRRVSPSRLAGRRAIKFDKKIQELRDAELELIGPVDRIASDYEWKKKLPMKDKRSLAYRQAKRDPETIQKIQTTIAYQRPAIARLEEIVARQKETLDYYVSKTDARNVEPQSVARLIEEQFDGTPAVLDEFYYDWWDIEDVNDWNTKYDEFLQSLKDAVEDGYYNAQDELDFFNKFSKAQLRKEWKAMKKDWDENFDKFADKLADQPSIKKDIKRIQTNLNSTQKQLDRQIAAFENTKSQIDDIRKQINERLDKIELNINRKFDRKKQAYFAERNKLYKASGFTNDATSFNQIDTVAKAVALQGVEDLLYDLSKNNKFFYNMRAIFPFGNAYKEILTTWAKLIAENPEVIRKGQVTVNALREDNPFSPVEGQGFIAQDEITGEDVFYYPFSGEIVSNIALGEDRKTDIRLPGYASSLNLALNIIPGVGPMVAIPFSAFFGGNPTFDEFKKVVFPYGLPDVQDAGDLVRAAGIPAWMRNTWRAIRGFDEDVPTNEITRVAGNTQIDVFRLLKANGEIDDTPEQQAQLMNKAKNIARGLTLIKAFSQFVGPTGLNARYEIHDPKNNGTVWAMQSLSNYYREILETPPTIEGTDQLAFAPGDNYGATKYFIESFGFNPLDIVQPKSVVVEPRPVDEKGSEFERNNKDLFKKYPYTAQFAIPKGGGGPFNYEAYINTLVNETREPLKPSEWIAKRNQSLGEFYMENKRQQSLELFNINVPNQNKQRNRFLALQQLQARDKFPGYDQTIVGLPATINTELQVEELRKWADEPKLGNTKVGKDLVKILNLFDIFSKKAFAEGLSKDGWRTSRRYIKERRFIRDQIAQLTLQNDDFYFVAQRVLLPYIEERKDFVEDLIYDQDVFAEYGMYLPLET